MKTTKTSLRKQFKSETSLNFENNPFNYAYWLELKLIKVDEYAGRLSTYLSDTLDGMSPEISAKENKLL